MSIDPTTRLIPLFQTVAAAPAGMARAPSDSRPWRPPVADSLTESRSDANFPLAQSLAPIQSDRLAARGQPDGGLMATKPYISGSNYLLKMSNYPKGPWQEVWDALFWRFMHVHRSFFSQNPRLGMLLKTFDKWDASKQAAILGRAEACSISAASTLCDSY